MPAPCLRRVHARLLAAVRSPIVLALTVGLLASAVSVLHSPDAANAVEPVQCSGLAFTATPSALNQRHTEQAWFPAGSTLSISARARHDYEANIRVVAEGRGFNEYLAWSADHGSQIIEAGGAKEWENTGEPTLVSISAFYDLRIGPPARSPVIIDVTYTVTGANPAECKCPVSTFPDTFGFV